MWEYSRWGFNALLVTLNQQNDLTCFAQPHHYCVGPGHNMVLPNGTWKLRPMYELQIFKRQICGSFLYVCWHMSAIVSIKHTSHGYTRAACYHSSFFSLSQTSPVFPSSPFRPLRICGKVGKEVQHGENLHVWGWTIKSFLWLSRRENVFWKPETSALVLKIFDEQIGMYSLLLGHMLHNSFHWKLFYTFWKKTLLPSQEHGR